MVYCGKASEGCQSCRKRRIKCDKVRPQCTQCIRVDKQCPGYRDQLSLMFRDESTKVIQKAHAQWGVVDPSDLGEPSGSSPTSSSPTLTSPTSTSKSAASTSTSPTGSSRSRSSITFANNKPVTSPVLPQEIFATKTDKAIQFYLEHYVLGLPDEPVVGQELQGRRWVYSPATRDIMAAVGLAGLSNLTGDKGMYTLARQHYGHALRGMAATVGNVRGLDLEVALRAVVSLAMFEVVRGREEPANTARTHIMGAAALLKSFLPFHQSPAEGLRGLLQMFTSMLASIQGSLQNSSPEPNILIPTQVVYQMPDAALPSSMIDAITTSADKVPPIDKPATELIGIIARFVQLSAFVRSQPFVDGKAKATGVINEALEIDALLEAWERSQEGQGIWAVHEEHEEPGFFPAEAVFEDRYHVYSGMWAARVWSHYRWVRILVSQMLVEGVERFPNSSADLISFDKRRSALDCISRLARDTLISVPTHYRHPRLKKEHRDRVGKTKGGAGIGVAMIPTLLFEVRVAACAPGIPDQYRPWALQILETIYGDTGMFQAKALSSLVKQKMNEEAQGTPSPVWVKREVIYA